MTDVRVPESNLRRQGSAPRSRVRLPWVLVAAAGFLMAAVLVLWAVSRAADRTDVLVVAQPVKAGDPIPIEAIGTRPIAIDGGVDRIYRAEQIDSVTGAIAVTDLSPGDLLGPSVLSGAPETQAGEQLVGAVLRSGRYPEGIRSGDTGLAVKTSNVDDAPPATVGVRIVAVTVSETLEATITMAVSVESAPLVGLWAANDQLAVTISPFGAEP